MCRFSEAEISIQYEYDANERGQKGDFPSLNPWPSILKNLEGPKKRAALYFEMQANVHTY